MHKIFLALFCAVLGLASFSGAYAGDQTDCEAKGKFWVAGQCVSCPAGKVQTKNGACHCLEGFIDLGKNRSCACPHGTRVKWELGKASCILDDTKPSKVAADAPKEETPYKPVPCDPEKASCKPANVCDANTNECNANTAPVE